MSAAETEIVEEVTEGVVTDSAPSKCSEAESHYFARFGSLILLASDDDREPATERAAIVEALKSDSRVVDVTSEPLEEARTHYLPVFPTGRQTEVKSLLLGDDIRPALKMSHPNKFQSPRTTEESAPTKWVRRPSDGRLLGNLGWIHSRRDVEDLCV